MPCGGVWGSSEMGWAASCRHTLEEENKNKLAARVQHSWERGGQKRTCLGRCKACCARSNTHRGEIGSNHLTSFGNSGDPCSRTARYHCLPTKLALVDDPTMGFEILSDRASPLHPETERKPQRERTTSFGTGPQVVQHSRSLLVAVM